MFCFWSWEQNIQTFIIKFDISYRFCMDDSYQDDKVLLSSCFAQRAIFRDRYWLLSNALLNLLKWSVAFLFKFISLVNYIELFSNVKPALHSWDSSHPCPPSLPPALWSWCIIILYIYEPGLPKYFFQNFLHLFSWMLLIYSFFPW